ncbi:uncharacterized protein LOC103576711 [Microplitis demolitor]|uniref:uncharacterized protein LOC103576711 n=1 Tax=Microplitis demolitor TaxID=69319 RepID=UPI0004CDAC1A|nr:uncharacterized protein LOC103576711 [Microplitis demolitor]XP_053597627.1 uncharacterized protein LOC103576711 [Microplitis demolitor]XP_053597628.1 uncharacterized protein LOC103576711 [Microplitis demolitor]XP_053597629.1 uncharacterized protein LOC103576711 [Microplitis demolitor]
MQRVLSFQMGRGFGEPTEFITKRMCCSLLFSIGFLCLLCGFLIGRFAAGQVLELRAEKKKIELFGNGLDSRDYLRTELVQNFKNSNFTASFNVTHLRSNKALESVEKSLSGLNIFNKVTGNDSCVVATVRGSLEPDRYVVLSADSENIGIGISVAKAFQRIYNEHEWIPRRTLIFLISADYMDSCLYSLSSYDQSKIVAYLAIDKNPIDGDGFFQIAGSDMVQTTVLEASRDYYNFNNSNDHVTDLQRLKIVIPHTLLSFYPVKNVSAAADKQNFSNLHRRTLAQVLSTSVWRLSEMTVFQWDPQILHTSIELLNKFNLPDSQGIQERIKNTIKRIINSGVILNKKIENLDRLQSLDIRMMNDFLKDLEYALLCPDKNKQSKTDVALLEQRLKVTNNIEEYFLAMLTCYEDADKILQDMT